MLHETVSRALTAVNRKIFEGTDVNTGPRWYDYFWMPAMIVWAWSEYPNPMGMIVPLILLGMFISCFLMWHLGWRKSK